MRTKRSEAIGVLCPSFSGASEECDLECVRLDADGFADLGRIGVRALGQNWRADPAVEAQRCRGGEVRGRGLIPTTLDGEPFTFLARVRVDCIEGPRLIALTGEPVSA